MARFDPAWLECQERYWLRPDAQRWMRPDAQRFMRAERPYDRAPSLYDRKYSSDQPRVPAGNPDGGQWTGEEGGSYLPFDAGPRLYVAGGLPRIPQRRPSTAQERNVVIKAVAGWLAENGAAIGEIVAAGTWLYAEAYAHISAYLDGPKSFEELREAAQYSKAGYDIHHVVEQTPAELDGFARTRIDSPGNLVRISRLKHWEINAWFQTKNDAFGGVSPRQYLRHQNWDERRKVGIRALVKFGVLTHEVD